MSRTDWHRDGRVQSPMQAFSLGALAMAGSTMRSFSLGFLARAGAPIKAFSPGFLAIPATSMIA